MSLRIEPLREIPQETQRVAKAVLPSGNHYMQMRDKLGVMFEDQESRVHQAICFAWPTRNFAVAAGVGHSNAICRGFV